MSNNGAILISNRQKTSYFLSAITHHLRRRQMLFLHRCLYRPAAAVPPARLGSDVRTLRWVGKIVRYITEDFYAKISSWSTSKFQPQSGAYIFYRTVRIGEPDFDSGFYVRSCPGVVQNGKYDSIRHQRILSAIKWVRPPYST